MAGYPLIIFGAGASFASLNSHEGFSNEKQDQLRQWKPPLTNEIFDQRRFEEILKNYPEAYDIDGEASHHVRGDYSLEHLLTDILTKKAPSNRKWYRCLMAFRFYIQELFATITELYFTKRSNYFRIVSDLNSHAAGKAVVVNFNYDLLFEGIVFDKIGAPENIDEYVSGAIKIIKIHGAYNWFGFCGNGHTSDGDFKDGKKYALDYAETIFKSEEKTRIERRLLKPTIRNDFRGWPFYDEVSPLYGDDVNYYVPDIAIPVMVKRDFVCPESHIKILEKELQLVDRIIIIGWKAADQYLLDLLDKYVGNKPVFVVSDKSSNHVASELNKKYRWKTVSFVNGFEQFLSDNDFSKILSAENLDVLIQGNELKNKDQEYFT